MTDSFSKKKTSFCLSLILTHKDSFCIVLFCFLVQCRENTLNALDLLPLTHKKTKTNRPLLRDRQGMVMTRPRSSLLVSFAVNKNNACQFSCMTSTFYAHKIHDGTRLPQKFTFTHEICQVMFRGE